MSIEGCAAALRAHGKLEGKKVPEEKIQALAAQLDKLLFKQKLAPAEFKAAIQDMFQKALPEKVQMGKLSRLQTLEAAVKADKYTGDVTIGKSGPQKALDYVEGGGIKASSNSNMDPKVMGPAIFQQFAKMFKKMTYEFKARLESSVGTKAIWQELYSLDGGGKESVTGDTEAFGIAKSMYTMQDASFRMAEAYNPAMVRSSEFIIHRTYNADKMLNFSADPKADFIKNMSRRVDPNSFAGATDAQRAFVFGDVYDRMQSGIYGTASDRSSLPSGTMQKMAMSREFRFKDAEAAWEHHQDYGDENMLVTVHKFLSQRSNDIAQTMKFGPNAELFKTQFLEMQKARWTPAELAEYNNGVNHKIDNAFKTATGVTNSPANGSAARLAKNALTMTYMAHAGGAMLSHIPDLALSAGLVQGLKGVPVISNFASLATSYVKFMASTAKREAALESFGVFSHTLQRELLNSIGGTPQEPGMVFKAAQLFGKLTFVERASDSLKAAIAETMHNHLGQMAEIAHADLSGQSQNFIGRYGFGAPEWDTVRSLTGDRDTGSIDGMKYRALDAETIRGMSDAQAKSYLALKGLETDVGAEALNRVRYDLSTRFSTMINEMASTGAARPGSRQMRFMYQGTDINTPLGILTRLFWQFKGAALTTMDNYSRILRSGPVAEDGRLQSNVSAYVQTGLLAAGAWTMSQYARDALMGKEPEAFDHKFAIRAAAGSGITGLFGDAIANEYRQETAYKSAGDLAKNFLGPVAGTVLDTAQIGLQALQGEGMQALHETVKVGTSMVPGQNIFWLKALLHLGIFNAAKELTHEGYLRNLERSVEKTPGLFGEHQAYFSDMFKPTEHGDWLKNAVR